MHMDQRSSKIVLTAVTLVLALMAGLMIPFVSGNRSSSLAPAWTPPSPTATAVPPTVAALPATTAMPASQTTQAAQPLPTALPSKTPQAVPASPVPSPTVLATPLLPTSAAVLTPARTAPLQAPVAEIVEGPLLLRAGPERSQPVLGIGNIGATYTVTARTSDSTWLQVCCVKDGPAWLSAQFVVITGTISSVPVKP